ALLAVAAGIAAAGAVGLAVGVPALRISGMHLAVVTVAMVFVAQELMGQWDQAHSENGVTARGPDWLLQERGLFVAAVLLAAIAYVLAWNLVRSRTGRALLALRDSPYAAAAAGINGTRYRLAIFIVSGMLTGAGGVAYL